MDEMGQAGNYRAAMKAAMDELGQLRKLSELLRNRLYQLDIVVEALTPIVLSENRSPEEVSSPKSHSIEAAAQPVYPSDLNSQMVGTAIPQPAARKFVESADPIQRRINSVLGMAVA